MRPAILWAALLLFAAATATPAQEPPSEAQAPLAAAFRDSQQLARCAKALDAECVSALSDSESYALLNGAPFDLAMHQSRFYAAWKKNGYEYLTVVTTPPRELYIDGGRLYTFVPYTSTSNWGGHRTTIQAYYIAFSRDGGDTWKFVWSGGGFSPEKLRLLIPSYAGQPVPQTRETETNTGS